MCRTRLSLHHFIFPIIITMNIMIYRVARFGYCPLRPNSVHITRNSSLYWVRIHIFHQLQATLLLTTLVGILQPLAVPPSSDGTQKGHSFRARNVVHMLSHCSRVPQMESLASRTSTGPKISSPSTST